MNKTASIRDPLPPHHPHTHTLTHTHQPELFSHYDEEPGGSRPDRMPTLSGPQEQVLAVSALPTFDVPVPQTVDQPVEVRQLLCLSWRFLSSPLTFQFALGVVLVDVFKVFSLARVPRLWSRSPTLQFLVVVSMEVSKVFTQNRVQQQSQSKSLTFQFRTVAASPRSWSRIVSSRSCWGSVSRGFSHFYLAEKSAQLGHSVSELSANFTPSTPPAQHQWRRRLG